MTALFDTDFLPRAPQVIAPGAIWIPSFLTRSQQRTIVAACREIGRGPAPFTQQRVGAHVMSVQSTGLGWHWTPQGYRRTDPRLGRRVLPIPQWLCELGAEALAAACAAVPDPTAHGFGSQSDYYPDAALLNFYRPDARMGMHQDLDERSTAPVISLSFGDSCRFRFGNTEHRGRPYRDIHLASGDLIVFGGPSRLAFHGVPKIFPNTAPADCGLSAGRLNITLRHTGLTETDTP